MRIAFAAIPAHGHLYPLMPLALACRDAGHQVVVAVGAPFAGRLPLRTLDPFGRAIALSDVEQLALARHPGVTGIEVALAIFGDVTADLTLPGLVAGLTDFRPDLVIYDSANTGAGIAADLLGVAGARLRGRPVGAVRRDGTRRNSYIPGPRMDRPGPGGTTGTAAGNHAAGSAAAAVAG